MVKRNSARLRHFRLSLLAFCKAFRHPYQGDRVGLAFLCGFRRLCGLFAVPIPSIDDAHAQRRGDRQASRWIKELGCGLRDGSTVLTWSSTQGSRWLPNLGTFPSLAESLAHWCAADAILACCSRRAFGPALRAAPAGVHLDSDPTMGSYLSMSAVADIAPMSAADDNGQALRRPPQLRTRGRRRTRALAALVLAESDLLHRTGRTLRVQPSVMSL
jgi:hypothetical protein